MTQKTIILANPRGFCAGVDRAISIVERALEEFGAPVYVRHEVVHNKFVVDNLSEKGAVFIEDLADVPKGAILIYSAHGVSKAVQQEAAERGFRVFDATCPLVTKVHKEVARLDAQDCEIIMIGHKGQLYKDNLSINMSLSKFIKKSFCSCFNTHIRKKYLSKVLKLEQFLMAAAFDIRLS